MEFICKRARETALLVKRQVRYEAPVGSQMQDPHQGVSPDKLARKNIYRETNLPDLTSYTPWLNFGRVSKSRDT